MTGPKMVPGLSYDSYTEGEYMAVLQYLASNDTSGPIGRDEIAEWIVAHSAQDAKQAALVAALEAGLPLVQRWTDAGYHGDAEAWLDTARAALAAVREVEAQ